MKRLGIAIAVVSVTGVARADFTGELGAARLDTEMVHHDDREQSTGTHSITGFGPGARFSSPSDDQSSSPCGLFHLKVRRCAPESSMVPLSRTTKWVRGCIAGNPPT